jgi:hypothetical protein
VELLETRHVRGAFKGKRGFRTLLAGA